MKFSFIVAYLLFVPQGIDIRHGRIKFLKILAVQQLSESLKIGGYGGLQVGFDLFEICFGDSADQ